MSTPASLASRATEILQNNDRGLYTIPSDGLYPHQWLWDSCFIAIGLRHIDIERAKIEVLSLLRAQWSNGMVPHMVFNSLRAYQRDRDTWRSWVSPFSPDDIQTSGITQPPLLAEAIVRVGELLPLPERRSWYRQTFPNLVKHHLWLYNERDPHHEGLTLQIHPWETGLDNTPPWMSEMHGHLLPWWIRLLQRTHMDPVAGMLRRDTRLVPAEHRYSNIDAMALYDAQRRLRRKEYRIDRILPHSLFSIEDVAFNAILIRANHHLAQIAETLKTDIPMELQERMARTAESFEELWDPYTETYYSRDFVTHKLIKEPSIASLFPLYAGHISKERAALLVKTIENPHMFGPPHPIPSVPLNSPWFKAHCYWQGPTWLNANWLIIDGLRRYGYHGHADALVESSLELVANDTFHEYFDPINGTPLGAPNFSWTAAVVLDWLRAIPPKPATAHKPKKPAVTP